MPGSDTRVHLAERVGGLGGPTDAEQLLVDRTQDDRRGDRIAGPVPRGDRQRDFGARRVASGVRREPDA